MGNQAINRIKTPDLERELIIVMLTNRVHQVAKRSRFDLRPKVHDAIVEGLTAE